MLNKLFANLPFNPSLVTQIAFYGQRMRAEASIRRLGFVFVALAFLVQFYAFASPPQSSLASSVNDLVNGGFGSAAEAAADCNSNIAGYGTILANYGITCAKVASAPTVTINSADWGGQLWSMGHLPYNIAGEAPISITGVGTLYIRYLNGWGNANYRALNVTSPGGQTLLLLYNCGNLTSVGQPVPVAKPPQFQLTKSMESGSPAAGSTVKPGTGITYRITFNNVGGPAKNVALTDPLPANAASPVVGAGAGAATSFKNNQAEWLWPSVPGGALGYYVDFKVTVSSNAANGSQVCNIAHLSATGVDTLTSNKVCVTVKVNAPKPPVTPPQPPVCAYDKAILKTNKLCVPCPYNNTIIQSSPQCKPCENASSQNPIACITESKTAANLTQNISDANNTTAQAGDVIRYTLTAKNTGKADVKGFVFQENLSDVMDYANVQDLSGGALDNKLFNVTWPAVTIPAGKSVSKTITVKVKDPVPDTPVSTSDPMHFDHVMTNVFGNTVNIKLPATVASTAQTVQASLPNTGPGESLLVALAVAVSAGYFWARSRLLGKEALLVRDGDNIL